MLAIVVLIVLLPAALTGLLVLGERLEAGL